ncbi:MAG: aminotransferase class I/II-fold pyridoxal phosphate-dependent enzyme, partial [Bacteroidaceae bacterium]|nr:aminotransferase class I/II-fold pyridoxal phosphate-dependent enzyme [Bacteroidaceae bacterium]
MRPLNQLVRPCIQALSPYSCARNEYSGHTATVMLDANESPYNNEINRYPDPLQWKLKEKLAAVKGVDKECIFLGNGSDEAIDLVYRIFCNPGKDNAVAISPTYGMYKVCADINQVEYRPVSLNDDFTLDADRLLKAASTHTKIIWLCSPNNPTGNCLQTEETEKILRAFDG